MKNKAKIKGCELIELLPQRIHIDNFTYVPNIYSTAYGKWAIKYEDVIARHTKQLSYEETILYSLVVDGVDSNTLDDAVEKMANWICKYCEIMSIWDKVSGYYNLKKAINNL